MEHRDLDPSIPDLLGDFLGERDANISDLLGDFLDDPAAPLEAHVPSPEPSSLPTPTCKPEAKTPGHKPRGRPTNKSYHDDTQARIESGAGGAAPRTKAAPKPKRTRSEICREAGKARQAKAAKAKLSKPLKDGGLACWLVPAPTSSALALVPALDWQVATTPGLLLNESAQLAVMAMQPTCKEAALQNQIMMYSQRLVSISHLAKELKTSRKTVTRSRRLIACFIVLCRKQRTVNHILDMHRSLCETYGAGNVQAKHVLIKYAYDEMSMKLRLQTGGESFEKGVAKLLQIVGSIVCMWKVNSEYLRMRFPLPTTLRAIEKCTIDCIRTAVQQVAVIPESMKDLFQHTSRVPISDRHASNFGSDQSFFRDYPDEQLHRYICHAHTEHSIAECGFSTWPQDRTGLLHSTLSFSFMGALQNVKDAMKKQMRSRLKVFDWGENGPGTQATEYRNNLFRHCCRTGKRTEGVDKGRWDLQMLRRATCSTEDTRRNMSGNIGVLDRTVAIMGVQVP